MSEPFKARFKGVCSRCAQQINAGDGVRWDRTKKGVIYHDACAGVDKFTGETITINPGDLKGAELMNKTCIICAKGINAGDIVTVDNLRPNRVWHNACTAGAQHGKNDGTGKDEQAGGASNDDSVTATVGAAQASDAEQGEGEDTGKGTKAAMESAAEQFQKALEKAAGADKMKGKGDKGAAGNGDGDGAGESSDGEQGEQGEQKDGKGKGNGAPNPLEDLIRKIAREEAHGLDVNVVEKLIKPLGEAMKAIAVRVIDIEKNGVKAAAGANVPQSLTLEIKTPSGETKKIDGAHPTLATLIKLVGLRKNVYLFGEPGSGKSTGAHMAADACGLPYAYVSLTAQTSATVLTGYMDAMGKYVRTPFRDCYENGGLFNIDELDNASANLLTALNSALANGQGAFPDGMIKRHADFVLVATGNTVMRGGNARFPDRRAIDFATIDRFIFVEWGYDVALEKHITLARNPNAAPWFQWIQNVRALALKNYPKLLVSPRSSFEGADLLNLGMTLESVADMIVFRGIDRDTVKAIVSQVPLPKTVTVKAGK